MKSKFRFSRIFSSTYSALVFAFLYMPIVVMIVFSFNDSKSRSHWAGFTFKWYQSMFRNSDIMNALWNTVLLAVLSALLATVIGTLASIGIRSINKHVSKLVMDVTYLPMLNPDIVTGVALLLLFVSLGMNLGFTTLLLSHVCFNIPYVILSIMPRLKTMNPNMYEAALDLGATPISAIWKIIIPEIRPGIFTGFLMALTMSIDDFVISFFTTGPGVSTLSTTIYAMARRGIKPEINALSAILFVTVLALLLIVNLRSGSALKKQGLNK